MNILILSAEQCNYYKHINFKTGATLIHFILINITLVK